MNTYRKDVLRGLALQALISEIKDNQNYMKEFFYKIECKLVSNETDKAYSTLKRKVAREKGVT